MKALQLRTFVVLFFLSIIIIFLDRIGGWDGPKSALQTVTLPVQYAVFSAKLAAKDIFSFLTFWKSGENRIKNLELRVLELTATKNEADALRQENDQLRKQLGAIVTHSKTLLPAPVLGGSLALELAVGTNAGIKEGQSVVYLDNLVGRVKRVTPQASFVELPVSPLARIPVKIGKARGLVSGQYNFSMILDRVAQNEEIQANDLVLTSGEGGSFLADLIVGKITKIISNETDLFQKAEIKPLIDYQDLTLAFVIMD